jgi:hypothetical protein
VKRENIRDIASAKMAYAADQAEAAEAGDDLSLSDERDASEEEEVVFERSTRSRSRAATREEEEAANQEGQDSEGRASNQDAANQEEQDFEGRASNQEEEDSEREGEANQEEEDSTGDGLSVRDEGLSEGEASSYGESSQFNGPPNLQLLIRLGDEHCRTPFRVTSSTGAKVAGICGQKKASCKRHASQRQAADHYQYAIGSYPLIPVSRGFAGHGLASGPHYTDSQIRAFRVLEAKEMARHVAAMNDDVSDAEEMEDLARDVRVKFSPRAPPLVKGKGRAKPNAASGKPDSYDLRRTLAASSAGHAKKKRVPVGAPWFGMVGKHGVRWTTSNQSEANSAVATKDCQIEGIFTSRAEAEAWADEGVSVHSASASDGSSPGTDEKGSAKANRRRKKNQVRKARKKKEKKETKAEAKRKPVRPSKKGRYKPEEDSDPSDSSDESSSDESSQSDSSSSSSSSSCSSGASNSSSSSNDSSAKRRSRRQRKTKSKKSRKASKKHKKKHKNDRKKDTNYHKFQRKDTSTGDSQMIYNMSINGMKIDRAVAPDSMRRSDRGDMYTAAVDVTSLPGGWNSNKGVSEELFQESQKIAQLTSTILASTNKLKGMEVQDTSWNSTIRHSLGRVKNRDDLFEFVKKLRKSKDAAFKQETNLIQNYMYQRQYTGAFIREYVQSSLLCLISARSYRSFFELGDAIRQLAFDYPNWESGPAKAMLTFHSEKLIEIRQFAVSRKQLILQVYTYLRDAQAKAFYHESMSGAIWERIASIPTVPSNGGGGPESSRCSYCNSKELHKLFNVLGQRDLCPVKAVASKAKAKEAAKWIVDQKKTIPTSDIQVLLASALTQFV